MWLIIMRRPDNDTKYPENTKKYIAHENAAAAFAESISAIKDGWIFKHQFKIPNTTPAEFFDAFEPEKIMSIEEF